MLSLAQIARDWGCAKSYVARMVKRGCPTDSYENARLWLSANTKRSRISQRRFEEVQKPKSSESILDIAIRSHPELKELSESLEGIRTAAAVSAGILDQALIEEKTQKVGAWISLHTRAVEARVKVEAGVREELERRGILVPMVEAQAMARKGYQIILQRLAALPQNISAKLNPADPAWAMDILQQEIGTIVEDAQKAFSSPATP